MLSAGQDAAKQRADRNSPEQQEPVAGVHPAEPPGRELNEGNVTPC